GRQVLAVALALAPQDLADAQPQRARLARIVAVLSRELHVLQCFHLDQPLVRSGGQPVRVPVSLPDCPPGTQPSRDAAPTPRTAPAGHLILGNLYQIALAKGNRPPHPRAAYFGLLERNAVVAAIGGKFPADAGMGVADELGDIAAQRIYLEAAG